jgi:hypothetical protein
MARRVLLLVKVTVPVVLLMPEAVVMHQLLVIVLPAGSLEEDLVALV